MSHRVFVNRTLNMKRINYIGFDMDHTLIRYNSLNFESLAYEIMKKKLVEHRGYSPEISQLKFDYNRTVRGLVIDKARGNTLKLSRYGAIRLSYHGSHQIHFSQQKKIYKSTYIDLADPNYDSIDTNFSISIASLFAQLVDLKDDTKDYDIPDYGSIYDDLTFVLDQAHRDGSLKNMVREDLEKFIIKDAETVKGLERFRLHGKKLFLLTNSDYSYTKLLLDYAITPFLESHSSWLDIFEFIITSSQKPRFFYDQLKFLKVNPEDGSLHNMEVRIDRGVYQGGCASTLTSDLNLSPDEILYIGDHIYGDIVRLKKDCAWRTALVVDQLGEEIQNSHKAQKYSKQISQLMSEKIPFESKVDELISENIESDTKKHETEINKILQKISQIDQKVGPLIKTQQNIFNPHWGEIMRVGIEESYFAYQVERFSCIYMVKISDFLSTSPRTYFRSSWRPMPHEIGSDNPFLP